MPSTTRGFSVNRSSSPKKSPYWESSPTNVVSPRLWYSVTSFSQFGTLRFCSAGSRTGVYGKDVAGSSAGKSSPPA
jgi:hypothetical protein